ncbi:hypothetical protein N431DRAFT_505669 [Stipitochalara longipes BDJ]|nr:hypothetical protein N431DRAFT_505669 [Stipitochalara longipes BDJ]
MATGTPSTASSRRSSSSPSGFSNEIPRIVISPTSGSQARKVIPLVAPDPWVLTPETLGDEIITLYVGKKRQKITVHKKLVCDRCKFFSKAFCGNFPEAEKGEMYLPQDSPQAVSSLIDYLYRGTLPVHEDFEEAHHRAMELYVLSERICLVALMDKCCDAIRRSYTIGNCKPSVDLVRCIYSNTCDGSKLRKYSASLIACWIAEWGSEARNAEEYMTLHTEYPDFFLDIFRWEVKHGKDVAKAITKEQLVDTHKPVEMFGPCEFHSHGEDQTCYLKDAK